ncbi:Predicted arabinose efflux permease, MFS family [Cyclobacterium xiamenense]|uniref:Predicted arabinose efflux permease, MFS family n=1 Tax=Cyclobacterium xiamenense TaxID=1297121 RepID=A0A1H7B685_9BACT|nr:Predicted arabinose efflux permease, MFS family [Cyclobacterium xiamenense]
MHTDPIKLGLKENWKQFTLLVIVNAFVGGMIGMERSIFPQFAELEFGIASKTALLSFITAFGLTKAVANYYTGRLANRFGRKNLLLFGWLLAIPIPFMLMYAPSWGFVIVANMLLGISQGLTWSSTVVMKIDLVGEKDRGLAMGLNEFAGYVAVGAVAFLTGFIANTYGITPYPFYIGVFISIVGFILTALWVKDTRVFVHKESSTDTTAQLENVFSETTFKNKTLSSVTQAGLINNLNDGMIWGLLPIVLGSLHFNNENIGIITAIYPTVWGIGQLFTGKMSDHYSKKAMLFWGMLLQGLAILLIPFSSDFYLLASISAILGLGTALVYPTFLSTIAQATSPGQRAESIGSFRLWRDLGYAFGAVISGITADLFGVEYAIFLIGGLTIMSSLIIRYRMPEQIKRTKACIDADEVKQALRANKKIQVIDVRSKEEFDQAHIPDAMHISLNDLKDRVSELDKDTQFVTACGKGGGRSADGAKLLTEFGRNAIWLCGGTNNWLKANGY